MTHEVRKLSTNRQTGAVPQTQKGRHTGPRNGKIEIKCTVHKQDQVSFSAMWIATTILKIPEEQKPTRSLILHTFTMQKIWLWLTTHGSQGWFAPNWELFMDKPD